MKEILFVVILAGCFFIPPLIFGQYWLFSVFLVFFLCFGLIEWLAVKYTGKTVSQKFWALSKKNKKAGWIIIICMLIAWLALLYHFADKFLL